jgi:hypothetical protein
VIFSIAPDFDGRGGLRGFFDAARGVAPRRVDWSAIAPSTPVAGAPAGT